MIPFPVEGANPNLRLSTPLTVIGMLVTILRERFLAATNHSDPALPWGWVSSPADTGVFIESGWNENLEGRNVRPGVWVDRDQNIYAAVSIGRQDQMPVYQKVRLEQFYMVGDLDVLIDCTAVKRGESMLLGSIVQDFLQMSSRIIMEYFGLRDISPMVLGRTVPFEKDAKLWSSPVQFRVQYEVRWATAPIATVFSDFALKIVDHADPEKYFRDVALRQDFPP